MIYFKCKGPAIWHLVLPDQMNGQNPEESVTDNLFSAHGPRISTSPQGEVKAVAGQQHRKDAGVCVHYIVLLVCFYSHRE